MSFDVRLLTSVIVPLRTVVREFQDQDITLSEAMDAFSREWIEEGLLRTGNNQSALAAKEGMHRNTLSRTMDRLGMSVDKSWKKKVRK
jgi:DNA-binding NtrC family response regulator